jgi:hypothetical protein
MVIAHGWPPVRGSLAGFVRKGKRGLGGSGGGDGGWGFWIFFGGGFFVRACW